MSACTRIATLPGGHCVYISAAPHYQSGSAAQQRVTSAIGAVLRGQSASGQKRDRSGGGVPTECVTLVIFDLRTDDASSKALNLSTWTAACRWGTHRSNQLLSAS